MSELTGSKSNYTNIPTIEKMILRGLSLRMKDHFKLANEPIFISTSDRWNVISSLRKQKDPRVDFPCMTFKLTSVEVNTQTYSPKALRRHGVYGQPNDSKNQVNKNEPVPINLTLEVGFLTDDIYQLLNFSNRWVYSYVTKALNMDITFDGVSYSVQVEPDSVVSVPEKDMTIEAVNVYEFTSNVIVHGYLSPVIPLSDYPKAALTQRILITPFINQAAVPVYQQLNPPEIAGYEQLEITFSEDGVMTVSTEVGFDLPPEESENG